MLFKSKCIINVNVKIPYREKNVLIIIQNIQIKL